ncbi:P-type conjugative transfer protein TrbG [Halodesulfovibrio sp.]|jgi:type IV secretion system protein VirB9|uniref:P-type conjugative transfer protein TrbG n=1 Tax=Halodesulfovibrio sp. TaxID=1912772 RepID=UPI0025F5BBC7|nr:P-type conjugative transfer protein TrbG [Halodesulfovibrio sp.]MCT4625655.1 P-type conjugative transfer protein TrbG [Halodesulfovibrio sp.]
MNLSKPYILGGLLSLYLISGITPPVLAEQLLQKSPPAVTLPPLDQLPPPQKTQGLANKYFAPERTASSDAGQYGYVANSPADIGAMYLEPLPEFLSKSTVKLMPKEMKAVDLSTRWMNRNVAPYMNSQGKLVYTFGTTLPTVVCSPLMGADIEMQEGEQIRDVILGDTGRWRYKITKSGMAGRERLHVIIKPIDNGLVTTVVIPTSRRVYHIKLVSDAKKYTPYVGFAYPDEQRRIMQLQTAKQKQQQAWKTARTTKGASIDLSTLDFGYDVTGKARWKPLQVYNDGTRTIIRLPKEAAQSDLPVLLVQKAGQEALVNYRVRTKGKSTSLIVDEIFEEAMLIAGVGSKQQKIEISKQEEE